MVDDFFTGTWTTSPEAEFINSLCPNGQPPFPRFRQFDPQTNRLIAQAFARGFSEVRLIWFQKNFEAPRALTLGENMVWQAIALKTIRFNKLCEKLPRRLFIKGHLGADNQSLVDDYGLPVLPPTGLDDSGLSKAVKGLLAKQKWITRWESDRHPNYGQSTIYTPVPLHEALATMLGVVLSDAFRENDPKGRSFCDEVLSRVNRVETTPEEK